MLTIKQSLIQIFIISAVFLVSFFVFYGTASAQSPYAGPAELEGYAWSSTIGWISMNCRNTTSCASDGGVDYTVTVEPTGALTGFAWSSNIGWIKFGGLSSFPVAAGNAGGQARLVQSGSEYLVEGWARACAGTTSGDCTSMTSRTDGWDGWISLRGTNYGVAFVSGAVSADVTKRFAWGSTVVGWVDFNPAFSGVVIEPVSEITSFTATPPEVELGSTTTLAWLVQGYDSCVGSNNNGDSEWNGSVSSSDGSHSLVITPESGSTVYSLQCTSAGVTDPARTVTVLARPNISIDALSVSALPAPNPDGTYDGVQFLASVSGIPVGSTVNYQLLVAGSPAQSGTVTQTAGGTVFSPTLTMSGILYGTRDVTLEIDLPAPGSITENLPSTAQNEDQVGNSRILSGFNFPPPPPTMSIEADSDFVRTGDATSITWSVQAPYVTNCTVVGNGVNESITTSGVFAVPVTGSTITPVLQSAAAYVLTCSDLAGAPVTQELLVEVIPNYEEI